MKAYKDAEMIDTELRKFAEEQFIGGADAEANGILMAADFIKNRIPTAFSMGIDENKTKT